MYEIANLWKENNDMNIVKSWLIGLTDGATYPINNWFLSKIHPGDYKFDFSRIEEKWDDCIGPCGYLHIDSDSLDSWAKRIVTNLNNFIAEINANPGKFFGTVFGTGFTWVAESTDGSYHERSIRTFETQEECYNDMMFHAIDKMKWNVEYTDVVDDPFYEKPDNDGIVRHDNPIRYTLDCYSDHIIHRSYSGDYIYTIVKA